MMGIKRNLLILSAIIIGLSSCSNTIEVPNDENKSTDLIILNERDSSKPFIRRDKFKYLNKGLRAETNLNDLIGHGYKISSYPFESSKNVGFPIFDVEKYKSRYPRYYQVTPVKESETLYSSIHGVSTREVAVNYENSVKRGLNVNIVGLLTVNLGSTYKEVFKSSDRELREQVYGELQMKYLHKKYDLTIPSGIIKKRIENYIYPDFYYFLYNASIDELLESYGGFLLTKYYSGAQLLGLYRGVLIEDSHKENNSASRDLNTEITATISQSKPSGSDRISNSHNSINLRSLSNRSSNFYPYLLLGRSPGTSISKTGKFQRIDFSIKTVGGDPIYSKFTIPQKVNEMVFDLSEWGKSVVDENNQSIVSLPEGSLIPISNFIEEDNLKDILKSYYDGKRSNLNYGQAIQELQEPYIEIEMVIRVSYMSEWKISFITRYGEKLTIKSFQLGNPNPGLQLKKEAEALLKIFPDIKIIGLMPPENEYLETPVMLKDNMEMFNFRKMKKVIDVNTGKTYLLTQFKDQDRDEDRYIAFTFYDSDVIEDYLLTDIIEDLPTENISIGAIRKKYYLIAL